MFILSANIYQIKRIDIPHSLHHIFFGLPKINLIEKTELIEFFPKTNFQTHKSSFYQTKLTFKKID